MTKPLSHKEFEKVFRQVRKAKQEARRDAKNTLTPALLRHHIVNKKPLPVSYGTRADGSPFTVDDLKAFAKRRKRIEQQYGKGQKGITVKQIWDRTLKVDRARASKEIRNATMYRIDGDTLKFRVSASPQSKYAFHQVVIRLDEWSSYLTGTAGYLNAAKNACSGRISIECDCGRHQYWYRYLCGILGCGIKPLEHAYPKIRNPGLNGMCCKHVIKVLSNLYSPAVHRILARELEKQAETVGFGSDKHTRRFLREDEQKSANASKADVDKAYKAYLESRRKQAGMRKGFDKAKESEEARKASEDYKKQKKGRKMTDRPAAVEAVKQAMERKDREKIAKNIRPFVDQMTAAGLSKDQALKAYATAHGKKHDEITEIAKEFGIE